MDAKFRELQSHVADIVGNRRPDKAEVANQIVDFWKACHEQGIDTADFANALIHSAFGIMLIYDELEEYAEFAKHVRDGANCTIRSINEHWPPVDHSQWPKGMIG